MRLQTSWLGPERLRLGWWSGTGSCTGIAGGARRLSGVRLGLGCFLACLLSTASVDAGWVWTPEGGWFNPARSVKATAPELLESSRKAFAARRYRDAALGYRMLINTYPRSSEAQLAYRPLLEAQFLGRDFDGSLRTIEQILKRSPDGDTVSQVVWRKYEIGSAYLAGKPRYFLGLRYSGGSYGAEILDSIVQRFPFLPFSDDALFHVAAYYFKRKQYDEAELIYERLIRDYPSSEWAGLAEFQIGNSSLLRLKGVEYDLRPLNKAELHFNRYLRSYPGGDKYEEAEKGLEKIGQLRSERLLQVASFYIKNRKPKPARIYLQKILRDHPKSEAATRARTLLRTMGPASGGSK